MDSQQCWKIEAFHTLGACGLGIAEVGVLLLTIYWIRPATKLQSLSNILPQPHKLSSHLRKA